MQTFNTHPTYQEDETGAIAPDTLLPEDLIEHLQRRKESRLKTIETTRSMTSFFISWATNITGFFLGRLLLVLGGSTNLGLAIALCFAISNITTVQRFVGFTVNYNEGIEVNEGQKILGAAASFGAASLTTWLSVKDFLYYKKMTENTAVEIQQDIQEVERVNPQINVSNELFIAIAIFLGIGALLLFGGKKKSEIP